MIFHVDVDAFFASVLVRKDRQLKGKPLLALGMGGGCVIAASYEAKAFGVKTGMRLIEARKLVPHAIAIPSDFEAACVASRQIQNLLHDCCPVMERMSVDEWYGDLRSVIGGVPKNLHLWADEVQRTIVHRTDLTVSVGIAPSKLLAKMASEYRKPAGISIVHTQKSTPNTQHVIHNSKFLKDRPAAAIPGIGRRRSVHSEAHQWQTAWDIAQAPPDVIQRLFGRPGLEMQRELNGEAVHPVMAERAPPKSVSRCRSFRATRNQDVVFAYLLSHLTRIVLRMRLQQLACTHLSVWLRDANMQHRGKDVRLPQPMDTEDMLFPYMKSCFERAWKDGVSCTQVGLGLYSLRPSGIAQYSLFTAPEQTDDAIEMQQALDTLHERYGRDSVRRGSALVLPRESKTKTPSSYGFIDGAL